MSAPDTNIETQRTRHKPALLGIRASLIYGGVLLSAFFIWTMVQGDGIEGSETQVEVVPGVGAVEEGQ